MFALVENISFVKHVDYYLYLLKVSWPALSGLFIIFFFLVKRLFVLVTKKTQKKDFKTIAGITGRTILTLSVLMIYANMFIESHGDWLNKPMIFTGTVEFIQREQETKANRHPQWILGISNGEEQISVEIDEHLQEHLDKEDCIEVAYLPLKKEVYRCKVLTRQAEKRI